LQDAETAQKRIAEENLRIARELQDTWREAETAEGRFAMERRRTGQLTRDLELASTAKQQADAQVEILTNSVADLRRQLAPHESKTFGSIVKRALQVVLDTLQLLTPGPLRSAVRKYYLNWFYFRIYPERRRR
jgi:hypothetical protein